MIKDSLKQIFTYGIGSVAQQALSLLLLPLYLRFFTPSEYGVISLLLVAISLLTLFANVGIISGLYMLYYEAGTDKRKKLVGTIWIWYLFGAGVGAAILIFNAENFSRLLFQTTDYTYSVRLIGALFFSSLLVEIPLVILRLEKKARLYVVFSLVKFLADFGLKFGFIAFLGRGIPGYFESGVITTIVLLISMLPFILKYVSFSINPGYLKQLLRLGLPFVFSTIAVWTMGTSDRLILNHFSGTAEVGIYSLAYTFANLFNVFLLTPFGLFWRPFFLSFVNQMSSEDAKILLDRVTRYTFVIGGIVCLALSLGFSDVLLILNDLFSVKKEYLEAAGLVPLLTLGLFLYFLHGRFANGLYVIKRPDFIAVGGTISAVINVSLNFLLIPRLGAFGAAMATAIAFAIYMVLTYVWTQRLYPVNYHLDKLALSSFYLVISFAIGWQIEIARPWLSLLTKLITGIGVFIVLNWLVSGILTKNERRTVLTYLSGLVKRTAGTKE